MAACLPGHQAPSSLLNIKNTYLVLSYVYLELSFEIGTISPSQGRLTWDAKKDV